ncbi:branched-chain amino acid ABC transporter permease [Dactylosporangium sp. NPDC051485]|uniref:branched-chain amino acid ABC transporter permease n=1 Tax=Dactylosporangium sp. NPDC051485 TaxID=3154846 RepID=UPI003435DCA1
MKDKRTVFLVLAVVAVALTWILPDFRLFQLATAATWAIAMLGLNLLTGYNGQISLGHGAFFGIGAYTTAICVTRYGMSYPMAILLAIVLCAVAGVIVGVPALRFSGMSLSLITVALAFAFPQLLQQFKSLSGGTPGIIVPTADQPTSPSWLGLTADQFLYLVIVLCAIVVFALGANLVRGRWGLAIMSVRDNPIAAASMGVSLSRVKATVFATSAVFAGYAGGLQVMLLGYIGPESVSFTISITMLTGIVLGGLGTISGALVGGLFTVILPDIGGGISRSAPGIINGVIIVLVMLMAPRGLVGTASLWTNKLLRRYRMRGDTAEQAPPRPASAPLTHASAGRDADGD